jgi:hypothetical protein
VAASNYYEVRCERCRTSFPPETKRCIHCGGPLGGSIASWLRQGAAPAGPDPGSEPDADEEVLRTPGRSLLWVVTAALAIGFSMLRACVER